MDSWSSSVGWPVQGLASSGGGGGTGGASHTRFSAGDVVAVTRSNASDVLAVRGGGASSCCAVVFAASDGSRSIPHVIKDIRFKLDWDMHVRYNSVGHNEAGHYA